MSAWGRRCGSALAIAVFVVVWVSAQRAVEPAWATVQDETLAHFQALVRFDTTDPPGREEPAAQYLKAVLEKEGLAVRTFELEPGRPNIVARLKGTGRRRPLLLMAHTDTVNVDAAKWTHPPFSATRDGGHVYGRGTVDDKDNVTANLMTVLWLKRLGVPLDRDVIFLAESGEEGSTRVGIQFMVNQHFDEIDAEYCLAEGGGLTRTGGQVKYATIQTTEKTPRAIEIVSKGTAGHGSIPRKDNPIVRLSAAVAAVGRWRPPVRLNETTGTYFKRLADLSPPEVAARYRALLSLDPKVVADADDWLFEHEPRHSSMLRSSASPNIFTAGYRVNVIPSDAKATIDVRLLPGEDPAVFLDMVRAVVDDVTLEVQWGQRESRPGTDPVSLSSEAFRVLEGAVRRSYGVETLPTMGTGATDMAFLRAKGMQCYGIGPALDEEDAVRGFGAHSDQERILESELHRFVRFTWEAVTTLAASPAR